MIKFLVASDHEKLLRLEYKLLKAWMRLLVSEVNKMNLTENQKVLCDLWLLSRLVASVLAAYQKVDPGIPIYNFFESILENIDLVNSKAATVEGV